MIPTTMDNPVEHFGLSKEQKEQLELLSKFHRENLLSDDDYEKQKQSIIDGTFKLDEDEPIHDAGDHLSSSDEEDNKEQKPTPSSSEQEQNHHQNGNGVPVSSEPQTTAPSETITTNNVETVPIHGTVESTTTVPPTTDTEKNGATPSTASVSSVVGNESQTVVAAVVNVEVEQKDFTNGTIGVVSKSLDLDILDTKPVEISMKYLENYGFEVGEDEEMTKLLKPLFEKQRDFNDKKINRQRNRWKEFIKKHNIGPNGFTTLEEYEQQRIFHFIEESNEFKKLVRKGIPMEYRAVMWYIISGANYQFLTHKDVFDKLKEKAQSIPVEEREKDKNFSCICKDVDRTFPTHPFYKDPHNQIALRNVLYLYSLHNPKVGYCQAMNFLAGIMLVVGMNVQQAFFTLDRIIDRYLPPDLYDSKMQGVYSESFVLQKLCLDRIPKLAQHLLAQDPNFFILLSPNWFLCIFLNTFPIETSLRIWDCFLHENYKILYRIAIAYLSLIEKDLMKSNDFQAIYTATKDHALKMFDCRHLIKKSFGIRNFSKKKILEYREMYRNQQKTEEQ
ncbi:hypothetical protein C9374_000638 [Naegleria lovaniensis]|uniref:Rab-GAP TBC domain-containing protein n=1 Tax=Naegleria lovaniensis TaxID=51637 RepID=A0AA88GZE3_NAELO|nr:uncharacterized protein C9374_000638 [Naegleria lovaniensis]KAG2388474.1 hypothetical protein C9374_000638 [Naegleria lovaniensis]